MHFRESKCDHPPRFQEYSSSFFGEFIPFLMSESGRSSVVSDGAEDVAVAANPTDLIQPLQELVERMMSVGLRSVE